MKMFKINLFQKNSQSSHKKTIKKAFQNFIFQFSLLSPRSNVEASLRDGLIMEVSKNIPINTYSMTFAYNGIYIIIYLKAYDLECIFIDTWPLSIFIDTSSIV